MLAQNVVHGRGQVLDASACVDDDLRVGVPGYGGGDLVEFVQAAGQLQQHDAGSGQQVGTELVVLVPVVKFGCGRVVPEGEFAAQWVLEDADAVGTVPGGGPQGECAVVVADDGDRVRVGGECFGRLVEDEPVAGVDREQVLRFDVGEAAERVKVEVDHRLARFSLVR